MTARRIGRFEVVGELGRGGMGVVLRAHDPALGRGVALKLVPPRVAAPAAGRRQLLEEARSVAALDHPNICAVYDVGESDEGEFYLAMALYEGQTLDRRLQAGRIGTAEATDITQQIAQGLLAAHGAGVIHRDIKPANIMLTRGGLVKILDFGIAHARADPGRTGPPIVGTLRYMAPEQFTDPGALDGRADAWALGATLYEMVAGVPPFPDDGPPQAVMYAILNSPPPLEVLDRGPATHLRPIIAGLLEKAPERRLTLTALVAALAQPARSPGASAHPKSVAVLPFSHLGADPDHEVFADGLTAEIIADLSTLKALRVTSWTSVRRYKQIADRLRDIARDLDVHYIVEGSVRRAGQDIRVAVQVIDATSDREIWSHKHAGRLDQIFDIQERVAASVVEGLRIELGESLPAASTRSLQTSAAYDVFLRARSAIWTFTPEATERAIRLLDEAADAGGSGALLLATRATALWQRANLGAAGPSTLADAQDAAERALDLDPLLPAALRVLGLVRAFRGHTSDALVLFERALAVAPRDPEVLSVACVFHALSGRAERAAELGLQATDVDPFYPVHWLGRAFAAACLGRDDDVVLHAERAVEVNSADLPTRVTAPLFLYGRGDPLALVARLGEVPPPAGAPPTHYLYLAQLTARALTGDRAGVARLLTPDVIGFLSSNLYNAFYGAEIAALAGDGRQTMAFLERAVALGLGCYPLLATHSRPLTPFREDPAFQPVLAAVRARWEALREQGAAS